MLVRLLMTLKADPAHELLSLVIEFNDACASALRMVEPNPFPPLAQQTAGNVEASFMKPLGELIKSVQRLDASLEKFDKETSCFDAEHQHISRSLKRLKRLEKSFGLVGPERLQKTCMRIDKAVKAIKSQQKPYPKQPLRDVSRNINEVNRICANYVFERIRNLALDITPKIRSAAYALKTEPLSGQPKAKFNVQMSVSAVISDKKAAADQRGIKIRTSFKNVDFNIALDKNGFENSISHLLGNAIKYTGSLALDSEWEETWIDVKVAADHQLLCIEIESWGCPITTEEYQGNLILNLGYRGQHALRQRISGSGAGLFDVNQYANANGGSLIFDTIPIDKNDVRTRSTKSTFRLSFPI